jgi:hypothetical protein
VFTMASPRPSLCFVTFGIFAGRKSPPHTRGSHLVCSRGERSVPGSRRHGRGNALCEWMEVLCSTLRRARVRGHSWCRGAPKRESSVAEVRLEVKKCVKKGRRPGPATRPSCLSFVVYKK